MRFLGSAGTAIVSVPKGMLLSRAKQVPKSFYWTKFCGKRCRHRDRHRYFAESAAGTEIVTSAMRKVVPFQGSSQTLCGKRCMNRDLHGILCLKSNYLVINASLSDRHHRRPLLIAAWIDRHNCGDKSACYTFSLYIEIMWSEQTFILKCIDTVCTLCCS